MLECPHLLLADRPTEASSSPGPFGRVGTRILHPDGGYLLGRARPRPRSLGWWRWLDRPALEVREEPDDSLLCTVQRLAAAGWAGEVRDANGAYVGGFGRSRIWDSAGYDWAVRAKVGVERAFHFANHAGQTLAWTSFSSAGILLTFTPALVDPFARMVLVACVLAAG